jgi:glucose-1-phosphate cytidylyltransferase
VKAIILAGGMGTRMREETEFKPKPMVEIGERPVLWHIMNILGHQGVDHFIVATGYRGDYIANYFLNYPYINSTFSLNLGDSESISVLKRDSHPEWKVTIADTGLHTNTGGRVKRLQEIIGNERFLITYGDGLADINLNELLSTHESTSATLTISTARPVSRFGVVNRDEKTKLITSFSEKPQTVDLVNIGFMVAEPDFMNYLALDSTLEKEPLEKLVMERKIGAYIHEGFWQPMDTYREYLELNKLWQEEKAPWKIW